VSRLGDLLAWVHENARLVSEWAGASIVVWLLSVVATVFAMRYYLLWIPADHFAKDHKPFDAWRGAHPALRWALLVAKNLGGAILILAGLVMLVTPGPGWLALLFGLALVDLPGKRAVERRILRKPAIARFVNHLRATAGHAPLDLDGISRVSPDTRLEQIHQSEK
jgi:hypothetical protein